MSPGSGELFIVMEDKFGINMKQYCREYEKTVREALAEGKAGPDMLDAHREKIRILQHERLVHLIVTIMVVMVEAFVVALVLLHPELGIVPAVIMLGLAVLLGCYFAHYFFLENTVQRWYKIEDELRKFDNIFGLCGRERSGGCVRGAGTESCGQGTGE